MKAEILSIGTELLLGNIVNTNSRYLAKELSVMGIGVYRITEVGDNPKRIKQAYRESLERVDLVFVTGGLGPTRDDLSKEMAMEVLGMEPEIHEPTLSRLRMQFDQDEQRVNNNRKQAYFPRNGVVLPNCKGTAPGCILPSADKLMVLLPGPPQEMMAVFEEFRKWWEENRSVEAIRSKILRLTGIGESDAAHRLGDLLDRENPSLAPYAKPNEVTLRITAHAAEVDTAYAMIRELEAEVRQVLSDYIYGEEEDSLEGTIVDLLIQQDLHIAVAESLTGGLVTATLINVPGVSETLISGMVTYSDEEKIARLGVSRETIETHTAVSPEVCEEMLVGLEKETGAEVCVSTTGFAGPEGDNIGLVFIGIAIRGKHAILRHHFHGDRDQIRRRAVRSVLTELWRRLR